MKAESLESMEDGEIFYDLALLKEKFEVTEICKDGWLILKWDEDKFWLHFAVMSEFFGHEGSKMIKPVFYGDGPTDNLRECRHTYWGENGYIFYPDAKVIKAGLDALSKYFDL